jgi:tetratricopeptide (TPR) repeat protein/tRNA A-37 threonylcarbamoyl transferase component Bud32
MAAINNDVHEESGGEELLDRVIAEFLRAESAGTAGDRADWLARYPGCATGLLEFFQDRQRLDRLVMPVRQERTSASSSDSARRGDTSRIDYIEAPWNGKGGGDDISEAVRVDTIEYVPSAAQLTGERYRPLKFHARGGMGEVWLAQDRRIGRKVAVKKLRTERSGRQARFLVEAQVTGQLEHPSVVPLHDMGIDENGQPYYVMKFVQGRALGAAIAEFHAKRPGLDWASDVEFRRLLETFVDVCNAVAYAHSKGVLHRDIKPDNIMLGHFGETLVVDWGLAKVMGQPDDLGHSVVRLSGGASTATQDGAIVGSPFYMSPEGAQQGAEAIDRTSDVYLLGATLYEILTGKPPRQGSSQWELIDLARKGRPTPPSKIDRSVPKALSAICMKAMAYRKEDRYPTPLALVQDVERYLAGEATSAYREPILARAARWVRRHRRGLLRAVALALVAALAIWGMSHAQEARMLAAREAARGELAEFYRLVDEAEYFAANTDAIEERAPYYDPRRAVEAGHAALALASKWGNSGQHLPLVEERAGLMAAEYEVLLRMAQVTLWPLPSPERGKQALELLDRASGIQPVSRGYYELCAECWQLLGEKGKAADAELAAKKPETRVTAEDHFLAGEKSRLADVGSAAVELGEDPLPNRAGVEKSMKEFRAALATDPRHFWARFQLGRCLMRLGHHAEGSEALAACVALKPASPWAYTARGLASALAGRYEEAEADSQKALKLDPSFQPPRLNLGITHWLEGNKEGAIADFDVEMSAPAEKRLIEAAYYRGQLRLEKEQLREAAADFSAVIGAREDFRPAYWFRALVRFRLANYEDAQADLTKFVSLGRRASGDESRAKSHYELGCVLRSAGLELSSQAKVEALVRAAEELRAAIDAGAIDAATYEQLGKVYEYLGKTREAIDAYTQGITAAAKLEGASATSVRHPPGTGSTSGETVALVNLRGWAYAGQNEFEFARDDFAQAIQLEPQNAEGHAGLGYALARLGHEEDARREASAAALAGAHNYLVLHNVACIYGWLSKATGPSAEEENLALAALGQAMEISPAKNGARDEVMYIRQEISGPEYQSVFPERLRSRPEFQRLLSKEAGNSR